MNPTENLLQQIVTQQEIQNKLLSATLIINTLNFAHIASDKGELSDNDKEVIVYALDIANTVINKK